MRGNVWSGLGSSCKFTLKRSCSRRLVNTCTSDQLLILILHMPESWDYLGSKLWTSLTGMFRSNPQMPDFVCLCPCDRSTPHRQGIDRNDTRIFDRCPCVLCGTSNGGHGCHVLTPRRHAHAKRPKLCWLTLFGIARQWIGSPVNARVPSVSFMRWEALPQGLMFIGRLCKSQVNLLTSNMSVLKLRTFRLPATSVGKQWIHRLDGPGLW